MGKKIVLLVVLILFSFAGVCSAAPFTIIDNTTVLMDQKGNTYDPGVAIGPNQYETSKIVVDQIGGNWVFDLYTVYGASGQFFVPNTNNNVYTYLADLALDTTGDGIYDSAIVLSSERDQLAVGLYNNVVWDTASDYMKDFSGIIYGEKYNDGTGFKDSIVAISSGNLAGSASASYAQGYWSVSVASTDLNLAGINSLGILWATATCGNDVIAGSVPVPEPSLSLLFGFALFGIGALGRRRLIKGE